MNPFDMRGLGQSGVALSYQYQAQQAQFDAAYTQQLANYQFNAYAYLPYKTRSETITPKCAYCGTGFIVGGASCGCGANRSS